ncbi:MAG: DUF4278 domain-containing protein [Cyanobacteria bacterium SBLK]|nr:DUF4278 domain-containing protein [Cyanobacteria bacterium SBLK]
MKLTYRGVTYNYNPTNVESVKTEVGGKYRGLEWRFRNRKAPTAQKTTLDLVYRGVAYTQGQEAGQEAQQEAQQAQPAPVPSIGERARALFLNKEREELNRQESMLVRAEERVVPGIVQRARALFLNKEREELNRQESMLVRAEERVGLAH